MRRGVLFVLLLSFDARAECDDPALTRVAQQLAENRARGAPAPDALGLSAMLRAQGDAHPWPRAWITKDADRSRLLAWDAAWKRAGARCGIGSTKDGAAIVSIDALADFESPLPSRARIGTWLAIDARVFSASGARVFVSTDDSAPHAILSSFDRGRVRARALPERPGTMTIQIVADLPSGPRPVLEWRVAVEAQGADDGPAPGETAPDIGQMVGALRSELGLAPIARDARLDTLALDHARRMMAAGAAAHDAGDGTPIERLQNAHISAEEAGENVAHAASIALAHRALWASPSHRRNLVRTDWKRMGVAAIFGADGSVWVVELFVK